MGKYYPPGYYQEEFAADPEYHQRRYAREARYLRELEDRERTGSVILSEAKHPASEARSMRDASPPPAPRNDNPGERPRTFSKAPRLLDVGCANGDFPRFMARRGWDVEGVEVSSSTIPVRDFPVYAQPFPKIPLDAPSYDAVTAWAVLEHVHNPKAYFHKAGRVLKPGGVFVFLVPNFISIASRRLLREDVPRHLFFFTRETVARYLAGAGLRLEREDNDGRIFTMPPENLLLYFKTRLLGKEFTWRDLPPSRPQYLESRGLRHGITSNLKYAAAYPLRPFDWALRPVFSRIQMLRHTYGVSVYVARKS